MKMQSNYFLILHIKLFCPFVHRLTLATANSLLYMYLYTLSVIFVSRQPIPLVHSLESEPKCHTRDQISSQSDTLKTLL